MKWHSLFVVMFLMGGATVSSAQRELSITDAVDLAQKQSPYYYQARNVYEGRYWQYNNFRALFRPQIRLNATVPTFFREIYPITQPDGSIQFRRVSQANNSIGLNIVQNVGLTGGKILIGSRLQRTDNFAGDKKSYFLSTPFTFSYQQGSLLYNELSWKRKLEPLYFETAVRAFTEEMEAAALEAAKLFFDALNTQIEKEIAYDNWANSDTLYNISKERFSLGTITKSDLLQLELNVLKARNQLKEQVVASEVAARTLKTILGLPAKDSIRFVAPVTNNRLSLVFETLLEQARGNRKAVLEFRTKRMEADQEMARARGENSVQFGVVVNMGTQQTAGQLSDAYRNLQSQQYIGVTLDVPLIDWGYRKSQIRMSRANRELVEVTMQQEELTFEQEIYLQVMQFNQYYDRLLIARKAQEVAEERMKITRERYLLGKMTVTDLNLALGENVTTRQEYIRELRSYWLAYYTLRRLTLYDFTKGEPIKYKAM